MSNYKLAKALIIIWIILYFIISILFMIINPDNLILLYLIQGFLGVTGGILFVCPGKRVSTIEKKVRVFINKHKKLVICSVLIILIALIYLLGRFTL